MGWRGTVRSLNAAAKRAERESQLVQRAADREVARLDRSFDAAIGKARSLEGRITRDPIKGLGLTYDRTDGFKGAAFKLSTESFAATIGLIDGKSDASGQFSPDRYDTIAGSVCPIELMVTQWGAVLAIEVANADRDFNMKAAWVRKSDPAASRIFLVDPVSEQYYHPTATTLSGDVIAGVPRIGLVAFESFRAPAAMLQLHIRDVPLQKGRGGKHSVRFDYTCSGLGDAIANAINSPSLEEQVHAKLSAMHQEMRRDAGRTKTGCLVVMAGMGGAAVAAAEVVGRIA